MNIEKLISKIKLRPGVFVGEIKLESVYFFISGFLYNNIINNNADDIDNAFKNQIHVWTKIWIEKKEGVIFDEERNCVFYINQTYNSVKERLNRFFEICEAFFSEYHKNKKN